MDYTRLVEVVLMQTQKFFCEYLHGNLTAKALSFKSFILYSILPPQLHFYSKSNCAVAMAGNSDVITNKLYVMNFITVYDS